MSSDTSSSVSPWMPLFTLVVACGVGAAAAPMMRHTAPYQMAVDALVQWMPQNAAYKNVILPKVTASVPMKERVQTFSLRTAIHVKAEDFQQISKISPVISSRLHEVLSSLRPIDTETPESWAAVTRLIKISVAELVPEVEPDQVLILEFVLE